MKRARQRYSRFTHHFIASIRTGSSILGVITLVAAIMAVIVMIVYAGYDHSLPVKRQLFRIIRIAQVIFLVNVIYNVALMPGALRKIGWFRWIIDGAMLITLPPLLYPHPRHPWIPILEQILYNSRFIIIIVGVYALTIISEALIKVLDKRTNPSLMLSGSFLFFIIIGSFLLMMPRCVVTPIEYIDSLFVASSAVCITGLTTIDVASTFTPFGLLILGLLIEVGALGVMTFTSFFALFFSGSTSIYNQLMVKDMIYSKSMNALLPTLLYILVSTLFIELVGAVMIYLSVHGQLNLGWEDELIFSAFMSVSAFCNAGFSNLPGGMSNPGLLYGGQAIYAVLTIIVFAGSLGFPILVNFKDIAKQYVLRFRDWMLRRKGRYPVHIYDVNTRIVLITMVMVFVFGAVAFFIFERNNTLAGMPLGTQIVQSMFNAVTPRSAGFSSVSPAAFLDVTIIIVLFQMWIGGGSQSTAGGVKVNTLAAIILNLRSIILGRERVVVFHRTISYASIRRANAVVALSILSLVAFVVILLWLEPNLPVKALVFEAVSALFTVGSSLGVTPELCAASKIALCVAMFVGRVGIISLLVGVSGHPKNIPAKFPSENLIIN